MPISAPGSSRWRRFARRRGFTLLELLIVLVIIAISVSVVTLALRDATAAKLEEEAVRLSALLEIARAESRASGAGVRWMPALAGADDGAQFRFVGLSAGTALPTRWLDPATKAEVVGTSAVVLGPEAILPAQRIVLSLADRRLELASDGLAPFALSPSPAEAAAPR